MKVGYRTIQLICVLYLVTWMIAPPLAYDVIFRLIAIIAASLWLFIQIQTRVEKNNQTAKNHVSLYLLGAVFYVVAMLIFHCFFEQMTLINAVYTDITTYILLFVGYIGGIYCRDSRYDDLKKIFYWTLLIAVVFSVTSTFRSDAYYELTRNAGGVLTEENEALAREAAIRGVGAFGFFCFTSVFAPLILWFSYSTEGKKKIMMRIAFFIVEAGVVSAGYTLALLISIVGIALCLVLKTRSIISKVVVVILLLMMLIFWEDFISLIYYFLQNISSGTMYENKVSDIFGFLLEGESAGSFKDRQARYLKSIEAIIRYPVLGSYIMDNRRAIGAHSAILDTFAAYGWVPGGVWTYLISIFPCKISNKGETSYKVTFFILLFLTALFNRYTMMMGVFYFVLPAVSYEMCKKNKNKI